MERCCVRCRSHKLRRSQIRSVWEGILSCLFVLPYRCQVCLLRTTYSRINISENHLVAKLVYAGIHATKEPLFQENRDRYSRMIA